MSTAQKRARRNTKANDRIYHDDSMDSDVEVQLGGSYTVTGIPSPTQEGISTRISREREQQWLQSLNRRLELYMHAQKQRDISTIIAVADLHGEEVQLQDTIKSLQDSHKKELNGYKDEIASLKKLLDHHDQIVLDFKLKNQVLEESLEEQRNITAELKQQQVTAQREVNDSKIALAEYKRNMMLTQQESERLRKERDHLAEEVGDGDANTKLKREQEKKILSLQNKMKLLENQLSVEQQQHEEEVDRLHAQIQAVKDEQRRHQDNVLEDFKARMNMDIEAIKQEAEEEKEDLAEELRKTYDNQIQKYIAANNDLRSQLGESTEVRKLLESQITKYKTDIVNLESANEAFDLQVQKLVEELELATEDFQSQIDQYQRRIDDLHEVYLDKERQFDDLMDIKVSLAMEINGYRRLIESEEERLGINLTPRRSSSRRSTSAISRDKTDRIIIAGIDIGGDFIKFRNGSTETINIANWRLVSQLTNETFVFHDHKIEPSDQFITYFGPNNQQEVKKSKHLAFAVDIFSDDREDNKGTLYDNLGRVVQHFDFIDKGNR